MKDEGWGRLMKDGGEIEWLILSCCGDWVYDRQTNRKMDRHYDCRVAITTEKLWNQKMKILLMLLKGWW